MAITKIHPIRTAPDKSIKYICNPEKTDGQMLISSFACTPETADLEFKFALSKTGSNNLNKAYHLIQSFDKGEGTMEQVHKIGRELASRVLEGKYSFVVSTHIDKGHLHNHIIFCAADNIEHKKYNDCKKSYRRIRSISDELCKENELSIIEEPGKKRGMKYNEWKAHIEGTSWKDKLAQDIDSCIKSSGDYNDFIRQMKEKGYTIKGESLEAGAPKYISFCPPGRKQFVRGSKRSLGADYTKERISERITEFRRSRRKMPARKATPEKDIPVLRPAITEQGTGTDHISVFEFKRIVDTYNEVGSREKLDDDIKDIEERLASRKNEIKAIEDKMRPMKDIKGYVERYEKLRPTYLNYKKAADKEKFYQENESDIRKFEAAFRQIAKAGLDPKSLKPKEFLNDYNDLSAEKQKLLSDYKNDGKELEKLKNKKQKLDRYMGQEASEEKSRTKAADYSL